MKILRSKLQNKLVSSLANRCRHVVGFILLFWLLLAIWLLLASSPVYIEFLKPLHFYMGLALGFPLSASLLLYTKYNKTQICTATLAIGVLIIILLESTQHLNSFRSVQLQDIIDGVAGIAISSLATTIIFSFVRKVQCIALLTSISFASLIVTVVLYFDDSAQLFSRISQDECALDTYEPDLWERVLFHTFQYDSPNIISTSSNLTFCQFNSGVSVTGNDLMFSGGGLKSLQLTGLLSAIRAKRKFTFGVRFNIDSDKTNNLPKVVARVSFHRNPQNFIARILHFNGSGSATMQFNPPNRTGTAFLNKLRPEYHDVVISYDGTTQRTWLDGELIGFENNIMEIPSGEGELVLNIGWRSDKRLHPFHGSLQSIFVGTIAIEDKNEVMTLFSTNS